MPKKGHMEEQIVAALPDPFLEHVSAIHNLFYLRMYGS